MEIKHYNLNKNFNIKDERTLDVFIQDSNKPLILVPYIFPSKTSSLKL